MEIYCNNQDAGVTLDNDLCIDVTSINCQFSKYTPKIVQMVLNFGPRFYCLLSCARNKMAEEMYGFLVDTHVS